MRPSTPTFGRLIGTGSRMLMEATSYLGSTRLATLPVVLGSWSIEDKEDDQAPGAVKFSVPNLPLWRPTSPTHPLAAFGQTLRVRVGMQHTNRDRPEWVTVGWFRIEDADPIQELLEVNAVGLLTNVERARLLNPYTAKKTTRATAVRALCKGIIPVTFRELLNEPLPDATWDRERLEALHQIVSDWPARMYVDSTGTLIVTRDYDDETTELNPVVEWLDGDGGTLVEANAAPVTADAYNAYRVDSTPPPNATDQTVRSGYAYIAQGPMRWGGPYGYRPGFYVSPNSAIQDPAKLAAIARTLCTRARRRHDTIKVTTLPDPRVEIGDPVRVRSREQGIDLVGRVTSTALTRTSLVAEVAYLGGTRTAGTVATLKVPQLGPNPMVPR